VRRTVVSVSLVLTALILAFFRGYSRKPTTATAGARTPVYDVDPMHGA
jgi:hypothetical protein